MHSIPFFGPASRSVWSFAWWLPAVLLFTAAPLFAQSPKQLKDHFNDLANLVHDDLDGSIEAKLAEAGTAGDTQLVLVLIKRFADYPDMPRNATDFACKLADLWKVGTQQKHKGILALISLDDRQFQIIKTKNLPPNAIERMTRAFRGEVTIPLRDGKIGEAMSVAADIIAREAPKRETSAGSSGGPAATPVSAPNQPRPPVQYDTHKRPTTESGFGIGVLVIGGIILLVIIIAIVGAFSSRGSYSGGYGGYGYGGYGPAPYYGGGDGGGNFFTGMLVGGMMNNMFGGGRSHSSGSHSDSSYSGSSSSSGWDSGGTSSWGSWGGGSSGGSWDSGSSWSSGGGDSSSGGGGDWGGGSSGGEW